MNGIFRRPPMLAPGTCFAAPDTGGGGGINTSIPTPEELTDSATQIADDLGRLVQGYAHLVQQKDTLAKDLATAVEDRDKFARDLQHSMSYVREMQENLGKIRDEKRQVIRERDEALRAAQGAGLSEDFQRLVLAELGDGSSDDGSADAAARRAVAWLESNFPGSPMFEQLVSELNQVRAKIAGARELFEKASAQHDVEPSVMAAVEQRDAVETEPEPVAEPESEPIPEEDHFAELDDLISGSDGDGDQDFVDEDALFDLDLFEEQIAPTPPPATPPATQPTEAKTAEAKTVEAQPVTAEPTGTIKPREQAVSVDPEAKAKIAMVIYTDGKNRMRKKAGNNDVVLDEFVDWVIISGEWHSNLQGLQDDELIRKLEKLFDKGAWKTRKGNQQSGAVNGDTNGNGHSLIEEGMPWRTFTTDKKVIQKINAWMKVGSGRDYKEINFGSRTTPEVGNVAVANFLVFLRKDIRDSKSKKIDPRSREIFQARISKFKDYFSERYIDSAWFYAYDPKKRKYYPACEKLLDMYKEYLWVKHGGKYPKNILISLPTT